MRQLIQFLVAVAFQVPANALVAPAPDVPVAAAEAITAVHGAAARRDYGRLRHLMASEFIWSLGYGAEAKADHAIAAWRNDPTAMSALRDVTVKRCGYVAPETIQCPIDAGIGYRAGFTRTQSGWLLSHFLEGD